ncbi:GNAT family N-acetyltransferase [Chryseobacterium sp. SNU WT5]|uniref:GNAT family N-acetyltransferase n=1 Tax=Chryseobacterium sp. SNU WT5 TaxID=2594269 RepID=UPI0029394488|nr:GNAT family N-acetyltransferase [Chryseobacterium sp. SNU WT5]
MIPNKIEIIPYSKDLKEAIKILNYGWLEKYFRVEQSDIQSLSNPKEDIIDKGGFIFYAKLNDEIVGTVSLLKKTETIFELGKMAVAEKAQGHKIGTLLLEHCLDFVEQKHVKT